MQGAGEDNIKIMRDLYSVEYQKGMGKKIIFMHSCSLHHLKCLEICAWKALYVPVSSFYQQVMKKGFLKRMLELYEDADLPVIQMLQNNAIKI